MSLFHALLLALVQGFTELFPVSSLGHAVVLPALLKLHVDEKASAFLPFLVVLHLGTLLALLIYFWREWIGIARGLFLPGVRADAENYRRLFTLLVVATLPAVVLGFLFERPLRALFGSPTVAALFLVANGLLLLFGDRLRAGGAGPTDAVRLDALRWRDALMIGTWQCAAFLPGISRSGAAMIGGLRAGLNHAQAARFSFLLTAPIITAAAALEVPKLLRARPVLDPIAPDILLAAGGAAGIAAFISTAFLMRYFRNHETGALRPYAYYCLAFGLCAWLALRL